MQLKPYDGIYGIICIGNNDVYVKPCNLNSNYGLHTLHALKPLEIASSLVVNFTVQFLQL